MGQVIGHRLKFDKSDEHGSRKTTRAALQRAALGTPRELGIFLIAANRAANEDGAETKVEIVGRNTATGLLFMVPDGLPAGDYTLEVRAAFSEDVRTGVLAATLTVG